ncbi:MAG: L-threonylcarbamoyladenylate synthase [Xanthomonadaceae bacterium]|nr:L-threonylcarbamoyladenylate synthase [Xanthomonadaceae bacterium]MBU6476766.1 L-threonylcarbamoyladenylate synthase [Xanthomonadaceae bacterium]MDE2054279.1 L-threonylcarbamoyladenylate synthase [Xanthomonadaceae bacterium]MDE2223972.1 L-threonylcarbamoyladenylate synthase [Xanthomonadaceae bacterium]MDE2497275.1 L-threonylcarbamoyladenylate synthase [Xanthomonadaceae bacterium]
MRVFSIDEIEQAAALLRDGGVLAYPTEGVYGLGCDPDNREAFDRIFAMKRRPPGQGVLLIAASLEQMRPWIGEAPESAFVRATGFWPGAHTFIFPRSPRVPEWVAGGHAGIALRVTAHAPSAALCRAFGGPIVSTSANRHGEPPTRSARDIGAIFGDEPDGVLDAPLGGLDKPTPITDAVSGTIIRA